MKYLLLFLSSGIFAATTGSLTLRGIIPQVTSITVTSESIATSLPLDVTQINTKVATINERSNSNTGYSVSITSLNLGTLKRISGTESVAYSLTYNGSSVNLSSGQTFSFPSAGVVNTNKDLNVSYTAIDFSTTKSGTYEDTLTVSISSI